MILKRFRRRPGEEPAGQSLLEFTLMLVVIIVLLLGVLDLGRAYFTYLALKDSAGEGAYFASAFPQCFDGNEFGLPGCATPNNIDYRVRNSAPQGGLVDWDDPANPLVFYASPADADMGDLVTVTVRYSYPLLTPVVSAIVPSGRLTLTAISTAIVVRKPDCSVNPCR